MQSWSVRDGGLTADTDALVVRQERAHAAVHLHVVHGVLQSREQRGVAFALLEVLLRHVSGVADDRHGAQHVVGLLLRLAHHRIAFLLEAVELLLQVVELLLCCFGRVLALRKFVRVLTGVLHLCFETFRFSARYSASSRSFSSSASI
ncbi:Aste57867_19646 [Aphanomyces stellatus]|uniref:Aste57867_19646 protein n=1 Tax=Aphanomyces stellatus TaxID=120398 RepID=A0A485LCY0_9STRA|nr:hypothetical protein As57867_019581 [Aphanomyces stellatus]VFT96346.1 Aste57867_19646 [Aphanomyces stellatus]